MQLADTGKRGHGLDVEVVERVAGVEAHAGCTDRIARRLDLLELRHHGRALGVAAARMEGVRIRTAVDLADRGADALRGLDLAQVRVDEDRDDDAGAFQALYHFGDALLLRGDV